MFTPCGMYLDIGQNKLCNILEVLQHDSGI